jgi:phage terminase small subunit
MAPQPAHPLKSLDPRQTEFVRLVVEGGDAYQAAIQAGFAENTARGVVANLLSRPNVALAIAKAARPRLARSIPLALATLEYLAERAQSEKVRLEASKTLLDRAGIIAPKAQEDRSAIETPLHELTADELRALAHRLDGELASRATLVGGDATDPVAELIE